MAESSGMALRRRNSVTKHLEWLDGMKIEHNLYCIEISCFDIGPYNIPVCLVYGNTNWGSNLIVGH